MRVIAEVNKAIRELERLTIMLANYLIFAQ